MKNVSWWYWHGEHGTFRCSVPKANPGYVVMKTFGLAVWMWESQKYDCCKYNKYVMMESHVSKSQNNTLYSVYLWLVYDFKTLC